MNLKAVARTFAFLENQRKTLILGGGSDFGGRCK